VLNHSTRIRKHIEKPGTTRFREVLRRLPVAEHLIEPVLDVSLTGGPVARPRSRPRREGPASSTRSQAQGLTWYADQPAGGRWRPRPRRTVDDAAKAEITTRPSHPLPREPATGACFNFAPHARAEHWQSTCCRSSARVVLLRRGYEPRVDERGVGDVLALDADDRPLRRARRASTIRRPPQRDGALPPGGFKQPYKIGSRCSATSSDRWNKGKFGNEYYGIRQPVKRRSWTKGLGLGREDLRGAAGVATT